MRENFGWGPRYKKMICHSYHSGKAPRCEGDALSSGGIYDKLEPPAEVTSFLESVMMDRTGTSGTFRLAAVQSLARYDPERTALLMRRTLEEAYSKQHFVPGETMDSTLASKLLFELRVADPDHHGDHPVRRAIREAAFESPNPRVRAELLRKFVDVDETYFDAADVTKTIEVLGDQVGFAERAAGGDPEGSVALAGEVATRLQHVWTRERLPEADFMDYQESLRAAAAVYERAVEAFAAAPGDEIPNDWWQMVCDLYNFEADTITLETTSGDVSVDKGINGRDIIEAVLRRHPESPRARTLLEWTQELRLQRGQ
jgi:hypothetical protein